MSAKRDSNRVTTLQAASNADGSTPVNITVDSSHALGASDGTTGSDLGRTPAARDSNRVPTLLGVSSSDYSTVVEVYSDPSGNLLINSQ